MNWFIRLNRNLSNSVKNYTSDIWFPLAIMLLNSIVHILNTQFIYAQIEPPNTYGNIQIAISVLGGFFIVAGAFITWLLISVVIFFWCQLFYDVEGSFRNFFEIVGTCHLVLLLGTLACSFFIVFGLPIDHTTFEPNTADSQELLSAITEALAPLKFIGAVGNICFGLTLVLVVQPFFQIRWLKAFCSVGIPYAIYWILSKALQSVFSF